MKAFRQADLTRLRRLAEVRIEPAAQDADRPARPIIWVVTVGDDVYVRSWLGAGGKWYQRLKRDPRATLIVGRDRLNVRARALAGAALNNRVDAAYQLKYGKRSPDSTEEMLAPKVRRTTLQLVPA